MKALHLSLKKPKLLVFAPIVLALILGLACGGDATPTTPATSTSPGPTATTVPGQPTSTSPGPTATSPGPMATTVPGQPTSTTPAPTATSPAPTATPTASLLLKAPEANPKRGGTLRFTAVTPTAHLDMQQTGSTIYVWVMHQTFDNLVRYDPFTFGLAKVIPDLADSWKISDDGLTYTFTLRDGVKWHDGTPLTAADVKATLDRIKSPPTGIFSSSQPFFTAVTGITAPDAKTVVIKLSKPQGLMLKYLAVPRNSVMQKKALDDNNLDLKKVFPVPGTGPFIMTERVSGEFHKYEKNPNYWNPELPYLDGLILNNARWGPPTGAQFLAGQCDVCFGLDPEATRRGRDDPEKTVLSIAGTSPQQIVFNTQRAPMNDARVRRAVHIVTDYGAMRKATSAVRDFGPAGFLLPGDQYNADYWAKAKDQPGWRKPTGEDFAEATKLLDDAGFADGLSGVVIRGRDEAGSREALTVMQGLLRQVLGVESELILSVLGVHYERMNLGDFDIAETGAAMPLPIAHLYLQDLLGTDAPRNWSGYNNPEYDALLVAMDGEGDAQKYGVLLEDLIAILDRDLPLTIWGHTWNVIAWGNDVKGNGLPNVVTTMMGSRSRFDTIWLDK